MKISSLVLVVCNISNPFLLQAIQSTHVGFFPGCSKVGLFMLISSRLCCFMTLRSSFPFPSVVLLQWSLTCALKSPSRTIGILGFFYLIASIASAAYAQNSSLVSSLLELTGAQNSPYHVLLTFAMVILDLSSQLASDGWCSYSAFEYSLQYSAVPLDPPVKLFSKCLQPYISGSEPYLSI